MGDGREAPFQPGMFCQPVKRGESAVLDWGDSTGLAEVRGQPHITRERCENIQKQKSESVGGERGGDLLLLPRLLPLALLAWAVDADRAGFCFAFSLFGILR